MSPSHARGAVPAALLLFLLTLAGCNAANSQPTAAATTSGQPGPTATPSPTATTRPTPTPTAKPAPKPSPTMTRVPQTVVTGYGPAGSMIGTGSSAVALTFDDGPDPVNTPKMLDLLKKYGVKATFCLVGQNVAANAALVRRMVAEGHTICNHTFHHYTDLAKRSDAVIAQELDSTTKAILAAAPNARIKYFRAPGGNFTPKLVQMAQARGMKSIYWAVDPRDWDFPTYGQGQTMVNHIIAVVESRARPGAIILSHDYRKPDTITAYATLLPWLKRQYKLIALPV